MITVALADDHPVVRTGLASLLDAMPDVAVVAQHATAEALLEWLETHHTDVVLLDLQFGAGRLNGAEATKRIVGPGRPAVLILTTYGTDSDIIAAVEAGATGYLLKDAPTEDLERAIRAASAGQTTLSPAIQERLLQRILDPVPALTARELEVLALASEGLSNHAIAERLFVSRATVKTHLAHVFGKLGAQSRTEAIATARRRGLLQ